MNESIKKKLSVTIPEVLKVSDDSKVEAVVMELAAKLSPKNIPTIRYSLSLFLSLSVSVSLSLSFFVCLSLFLSVYQNFNKLPCVRAHIFVVQIL